MPYARFDVDKWTRFEYDRVPIYVNGDKPDWFVPNHAGDRVLQTLRKEHEPCLDIQTERFLLRLPESESPPYPGRRALLSTDKLHELWFHITNQCNQACSHCMFGCSPAGGAQLSAQQVLSVAKQAWDLGCRTFALTGGEPFIHPEFPSIIEELLTLLDVHLVVLTNGTLLQELEKYLKHWPMERLHLQISIDGMQSCHDAVRGKGSFEHLTHQLAWMKAKEIPFTASMCVRADNVEDISQVVDFAVGFGCTSVHFMWYFARGRGRPDHFTSTEHVFEKIIQAESKAKQHGIGIDNLDALCSQVFAPTRTIHDGTNSAWESLAVGPDGRLYPSPALIGFEELSTNLDGDLAKTWRKSPILDRIRDTSALDMSSALRFLLGGGDSDHSYTHTGRLTGSDPYWPLYEKLALWLIANQVSHLDPQGSPRLLFKMGDRLESCGAHGGVALVHSNCLLSLARPDSRVSVQEFYHHAALLPRENILNPAIYPEEIVEHIPRENRVRAYGCGSPVLDGALCEGERVVDLGSGSGMECFIAAKMVGSRGRVIGIDMLDSMLGLAQEAAKVVSRQLGYENLEFRKGYLESLPLDDNSIDLVLSNCVINLSTNKRRIFSEICRVLRPGGRLCISDVVCEREPDATIRNNKTLLGECVAGALTQRDLFGLLEESGLVSTRVINQFPYRTINDHPFFSMTYQAFKPKRDEIATRVMYRGPFPALFMENGKLLPRGISVEVTEDLVRGCSEDVYLFNDNNIPVNTVAQSCCSCTVTPEDRQAPQPEKKHRTGCMVCKADLTYFENPQEAQCFYCNNHASTQAMCKQGHFVCDTCHIQDGLKAIQQICLETKETDLLKLLAWIRKHPSIPIHGPEHHAMVPGVVLATYRNLGGSVDDDMIRCAIQRGAKVIGGHCAFMGVCGAATGLGIAFSLILGANPLKAKERHLTQTVTQEVLREISSLEAARCCQRDCTIALRKTAELSRQILPIRLRADYNLVCNQQKANSECLGEKCLLWKANA